MNKIVYLKEAFAKGGFKGISLIMRDYKNRHTTDVPKCKWKIEDIIACDMAQFFKKFGYFFDINSPVSFTEKIHAYKLLYNDPQMATVVDKYEFKKWVANRLLSDRYTAKAYGVWESVEDIKRDWDRLPEEFVLKSTISSDGNNIIFVENKKECSFESVKSKLERAFDPLSTQLNGFARAYYSLRPRVLAEEYIHEFGGSENLKDYKFFSFGGKVEFVYTTSRLFEEGYASPSDADYPRTFFDREWNKLPIALGNHPTADSAPKPDHFEEMVEIAENLSAQFPFARVDFYELEEGPLLGEITFYPTGGMKPITPTDFDKKLGEKLILSEDKVMKI